MPKGPFSTQYIGGIVADQLSKMAATIIGSTSKGTSVRARALLVPVQ